MLSEKSVLIVGVGLKDSEIIKLGLASVNKFKVIQNFDNLFALKGFVLRTTLGFIRAWLKLT